MRPSNLASRISLGEVKLAYACLRLYCRSLQIDQVPEPRRTAPRALQFGVTQVAIDGGHSPHSLATALGYEYVGSSVPSRATRCCERRALTICFAIDKDIVSSLCGRPDGYIVVEMSRYSCSSSVPLQ